jgi:flagellar biosynthesis protein FliP
LHPSTHPEHTLVITSFKRLIVALAFVLPAAALVTSPVMAASHTKAKHHVSVHKASTHKTHSKKSTAPTAS